MSSIPSLTPQQLYRRCDSAQFAFATTAELEDLAEIIGQTRALDAIRFGSDSSARAGGASGPVRQPGHRFNLIKPGALHRANGGYLSRIAALLKLRQVLARAAQGNNKKQSTTGRTGE